MSTIKNNINTYADLTAYNADLFKDFPNISYVQGTDEVKWVQYDPDHIVCKYNVASTTYATKLLNTNTSISYQIIDGIQQQSVQTTYTFDTLGEHIVKYKMNGTTVVGNSFNGCTYLTSVTIPYGFTDIGVDAFLNCVTLANVVIPNSVTDVGRNAFNGCRSLISIDIPNSVTSIVQQAFNDCIKLSNVTIGNSVTSIGSSAFSDCRSLTSVTIQATTPPTLDGTYVFYNANANLVIYVPAESVEAYKTATNWSTYASKIQAIPTT